MRCRHPLSWRARNQKHMWCTRCFATIPWGPSNDTPEALVELRAARLARDYHESCDAFGPHEAAGWKSAKFDSHTIVCKDLRSVMHEVEAGYLAYLIIHHDTLQAEASEEGV